MDFTARPAFRTPDLEDALKKADRVRTLLDHDQRPMPDGVQLKRIQCIFQVNEKQIQDIIVEAIIFFLYKQENFLDALADDEQQELRWMAVRGRLYTYLREESSWSTIDKLSKDNLSVKPKDHHDTIFHIADVARDRIKGNPEMASIGSVKMAPLRRILQEEGVRLT